jgi:hypothetical protein
MPMFMMDDESHRNLKAYVAAHGVTMTSVVRTALARFFESPTEIISKVDGRARGVWYVNLYIWVGGDTLETASGPHTIQSTGELGRLAATELDAPELAALVTADLPRLRQVLARVQSTSARIPLGEGGRICQIDVHRDAPL